MLIFPMWYAQPPARMGLFCQRRPGVGYPSDPMSGSVVVERTGKDDGGGGALASDETVAVTGRQSSRPIFSNHMCLSTAILELTSV